MEMKLIENVDLETYCRLFEYHTRLGRAYSLHSSTQCIANLPPNSGITLARSRAHIHTHIYSSDQMPTYSKNCKCNLNVTKISFTNIITWISRMSTVWCWILSLSLSLALGLLVYFIPIVTQTNLIEKPGSRIFRCRFFAFNCLFLSRLGSSWLLGNKILTLYSL